MLEYRKFYLTLNQSAPEGNTGVAAYSITNENEEWRSWIVWVGEEGTFPEDIISLPMTEIEIQKFIAGKRLKLSRLDFQRRFTFNELVAIETAASTDPVIRVLQNQQLAAEFIDVGDEATILGVMYLNSVGLLTTERANTILTL